MRLVNTLLTKMLVVFLSESNLAVSLSEYDDLAEIIKNKRHIPVFGGV